MEIRIPRDDTEQAIGVAALLHVVTDLAQAIHHLDPAAVPERLRAARIAVQSMEAGRIDLTETQVAAHRLRLAMLERIADQIRMSETGQLEP